MALFVLICTDKPDHLELRQSVRPAHLDYLRTQGRPVRLAGPFKDAAGRPNGSLLVIEAADAADARAFAAADPYALAGLFAAVEVRAWTASIGGALESGEA